MCNLTKRWSKWRQRDWSARSRSTVGVFLVGVGHESAVVDVVVDAIVIVVVVTVVAEAVVIRVQLRTVGNVRTVVPGVLVTVSVPEDKTLRLLILIKQINIQCSAVFCQNIFQCPRHCLTSCLVYSPSPWSERYGRETVTEVRRFNKSSYKKQKCKHLAESEFMAQNIRIFTFNFSFLFEVCRAQIEIIAKLWLEMHKSEIPGSRKKC